MRSAAPLLWHDDRLFAVTARGSATMIRAATGEVLWSRSLGPSHIEPAAAAGFVYVALDDGRVAALAASESGQTAWETKLPAPATTLDLVRRPDFRRRRATSSSTASRRDRGKTKVAVAHRRCCRRPHGHRPAPRLLRRARQRAARARSWPRPADVEGAASPPADRRGVPGRAVAVGPWDRGRSGRLSDIDGSAIARLAAGRRTGRRARNCASPRPARSRVCSSSPATGRRNGSCPGRLRCRRSRSRACRMGLPDIKGCVVEGSADRRRRLTRQLLVHDRRQPASRPRRSSPVTAARTTAGSCCRRCRPRRTRCRPRR